MFYKSKLDLFAHDNNDSTDVIDEHDDDNDDPVGPIIAAIQNQQAIKTVKL